MLKSIFSTDPLSSIKMEGRGGGGWGLYTQAINLRLQQGIALVTLPVNNNLHTCNLHCLLYSRLYSNIIRSRITPSNLRENEKNEAGDVRSHTKQRGWARNSVKTKIVVQAGVYKCLLPFICFSYGVYLSVLVICYAFRGNVVYNTHKHSSRWGVIPIFDSW